MERSSFYIIQMLLFNSFVPAVSLPFYSQQTGIKFITLVRIAYTNCSMINAKKDSSLPDCAVQAGMIHLPFGLTFSFREIDKLKVMIVGIMKVKGFDSLCAGY